MDLNVWGANYKVMEIDFGMECDILRFFAEKGIREIVFGVNLSRKE